MSSKFSCEIFQNLIQVQIYVKMKIINLVFNNIFALKKNIL